MKLVTFALVGCAVNALFADPARQLIRVSAPPQNPAVEQPHQQNAGHVALQGNPQQNDQQPPPDTLADDQIGGHDGDPPVDPENGVEMEVLTNIRNVPGRSAGMDNSGTAQCPRAIPERTSQGTCTMTIGRIPKVDPGATQPQDRKPSRPLAAGFKTAPSGRIGCRPNRRSPHPAPPSNRRPRRADDPGVQERGRRGASRQACASSNVIPGSGRQRSRIREGILATAGWRIHRVGKTGAKARKQSFAATVASAFGTTPGANDGRLEENGQWLEPVPRNPNRTNSLPRPSPAGNSSTTTTQPSGRPKPAQPSTARAPDPGGSMPKLALANTELSASRRLKTSGTRTAK